RANRRTERSNSTSVNVLKSCENISNVMPIPSQRHNKYNTAISEPRIALPSRDKPVERHANQKPRKQVLETLRRTAIATHDPISPTRNPRPEKTRQAQSTCDRSFFVILATAYRLQM